MKRAVGRAVFRRGFFRYAASLLGVITDMEALSRWDAGAMHTAGWGPMACGHGLCDESQPKGFLSFKAFFLDTTISFVGEICSMSRLDRLLLPKELRKQV